MSLEVMSLEGETKEPGFTLADRLLKRDSIRHNRSEMKSVWGIPDRGINLERSSIRKERGGMPPYRPEFPPFNTKQNLVSCI